MPATNEISPDGVPSGEATPVAEAAVETPVAEVTSTEPEINFDSFGAVKDMPEMSKEKEPVKEVEAEVVPASEVKKEEIVAKPAAEVKAAGQPVIGKKGAIARDYSGLPENVVPLFKTMGNDAFNTLKPFYLEATKAQAELAELKKNPPIAQAGGIPETYYEHPEAYTLTPEYNQAATAANEAQLVLEHWREQLDNVRQGATDFVTLQRDPVSKQIVYAAKQKVDQRTQSYLESLFFNANSQASQFQQSLGRVKAEYSSKHTELTNSIRTWEKDFFKVFEDDKTPLNAIYKDTLSKMPKAVQKNILASPLAKALTSIDALLAKLKSVETGKATVTVEDKKKLAQTKAGPTASGLSADNTSNKGEVTMDDFAKVKADE